MPILRTLTIALLAAAVLAGCGRRGGLEEPGTAVTESASPAPLTDGISPLDLGAPVLESDEPPEPETGPKRSFFLDFLL